MATDFADSAKLQPEPGLRALIFEAVGRVSIATVADPVLAEPGDALVAVEVAGLCGSDLHVYRGLEPGLDPGTPMGHELLGTIAALGRDVSKFRVGDRFDRRDRGWTKVVFRG